MEHHAFMKVLWNALTCGIEGKGWKQSMPTEL